MFLLDFLSAVLLETFWVLYDGGIYILLGFAIAGLVHVLFDSDRVVRHLGGRGLRSALVAALFGAPLPLCSCGVLPAAMELRRKGASREATLSFLITTPETGVDSVAVTWAFFGPVLAVIRPVVAIVTGVVAALFSLREPDAEPEGAAPGEPCGDPACPAADPAHAHAEALAHDHGAPRAEGAIPRLRIAARYAFVDLFDDLGFWLVFAFVLTGILSALLPPDFFARMLPGTILPMLAMIAVGIPLYVCASASTPLAALFVAKGASVGTALVFLLCGPATNAATIGAITRLLGRRFLRIYLGAIVGVALAAGLLVDLLLPDLAKGVRVGPEGDGSVFGLVKTFGAVTLLALLFWSLRRTGFGPGLRELRDNATAAWGWLRGLRLRPILASRVTQAFLGLWLASVVAGGIVSVPAGSVALVERFGRLVGEPRPPGAVLAIPGVERAVVVAVDAVREEPVGYRTLGRSLARTPVVDESTFVTGDENVIDVHAEAQFRVSDAVAFATAVERPEAILAGLLRARMVEVLAGTSIDRVYTNGRDAAESALLLGVRADAEELGLGVDVLAVNLLDVHAPPSVHDAFRDVASAHEDRLTTIHRANEYRAGEIALARGNAERTLEGARARAAERVASAEGGANAFRALAEEYRRAPRALEDRLYLETAERALSGPRKVIRPSSGEGRGTELWLRTGDGAIPFPPQPAPAAPAPAQPARKP